MITYAVLPKFLISNLLKYEKLLKSKRSLILIMITYVILHKFLIQNLLKMRKTFKNQRDP